MLDLPTRTQSIQEYKQQGGRIAAVFPIHHPRALFRAFNFLPVEVWGPPGIDVIKGGAHLQPYVCSIVQNGLSFLLNGGLEVADLLVVPHACDSLQGLGSILIDFVRPRQPVFPIYIPRGCRQSDLAFFTDELRLLYRRLQEVTGSEPSSSLLMSRIHIEEEADQLLGSLHKRRSQLGCSNYDLYRIIRSREYLPAEGFIQTAQNTLSAAGPNDTSGIPIILSGIVPEPMEVLAYLAELGGSVVADDLACCGRRLYPAGESNEPFRRMAESILFAPPDSTRGTPISERRDHLLRLVAETGARGIIFYGVKFCEPELFDLPLLRQALQDAGVASLAIEVDINDPLSQQIRTRIEAFLEIIG